MVLFKSQTCRKVASGCYGNSHTFILSFATEQVHSLFLLKWDLFKAWISNMQLMVPRHWILSTELRGLVACWQWGLCWCSFNRQGEGGCPCWGQVARSCARAAPWCWGETGREQLLLGPELGRSSLQLWKVADHILKQWCSYLGSAAQVSGTGSVFGLDGAPGTWRHLVSPLVCCDRALRPEMSPTGPAHWDQVPNEIHRAQGSPWVWKFDREWCHHSPIQNF